MSVYKEVFIKGYYRKNGQFVSPHIRNVRVSNKFSKTRVIKSYQTADKNQLTFNFSGKT
jgi:hypothetical protein|tara:strand:- start:186 stop:362 length:177 start_codon:yes stop_codon:yes gene_type:complete